MNHPPDRDDSGEFNDASATPAAQRAPEEGPRLQTGPVRTGFVREDSCGTGHAADGPCQPPARPAPLIRRAAALLLDLILIALLGLLLAVAAFYGVALGLRQAGQALPSRDLVFSLAETFSAGWPLLVLAYFGYFTGGDGRTPGKLVSRIMVVTAHGTAVGPLRAWWRACLLSASLPVFPILIVAVVTPRNRALHDYLAGTRVIAAPSAPSSIPT
ncbi:MAG TPA: RDD family protein [Nitrospiria bacterium]|nr:RDD family protein [Nitrospiria bacterium]